MDEVYTLNIRGATRRQVNKSLRTHTSYVTRVNKLSQQRDNLKYDEYIPQRQQEVMQNVLVKIYVDRLQNVATH